VPSGLPWPVLERSGQGRQTGPQPSIRDLIARAVQAKGGLEKLRAVRTVKATSTTTMIAGAEGSSRIETTSYIEYPGSFRVDAETTSGSVVRVFSAGECWIQDARGVRTAPPAEAEMMRSTVQRDVIGLLLALADGKVPATRLPDVVDDGRGFTALGVGGAMQPVVLLLDPATDLIRAQRYEAPAAAGGRETVEEQFSDYRNIDGLQVAFAAVVQAAGLPILTRRVRTFEYNVPLAVELFTRPL
jgi:hypothetical protein